MRFQKYFLSLGLVLGIGASALYSVNTHADFWNGLLKSMKITKVTQPLDDFYETLCTAAPEECAATKNAAFMKATRSSYPQNATGPLGSDYFILNKEKKIYRYSGDATNQLLPILFPYFYLDKDKVESFFIKIYRDPHKPIRDFEKASRESKKLDQIVKLGCDRHSQIGRDGTPYDGDPNPKSTKENICDYSVRASQILEKRGAKTPYQNLRPELNSGTKKDALEMQRIVTASALWDLAFAAGDRPYGYASFFNMNPSESKNTILFHEVSQMETMLSKFDSKTKEILKKIKDNKAFEGAELDYLSNMQRGLGDKALQTLEHLEKTLPKTDKLIEAMRQNCVQNKKHYNIKGAPNDPKIPLYHYQLISQITTPFRKVLYKHFSKNFPELRKQFVDFHPLITADEIAHPSSGFFKKLSDDIQEVDNKIIAISTSFDQLMACHGEFNATKQPEPPLRENILEVEPRDPQNPQQPAAGGAPQGGGGSPSGGGDSGGDQAQKPAEQPKDQCGAGSGSLVCASEKKVDANTPFAETKAREAAIQECQERNPGKSCYAVCNKSESNERVCQGFVNASEEQLSPEQIEGYSRNIQPSTRPASQLGAESNARREAEANCAQMTQGMGGKATCHVTCYTSHDASGQKMRTCQPVLRQGNADPVESPWQQAGINFRRNDGLGEGIALENETKNSCLSYLNSFSAEVRARYRCDVSCGKASGVWTCTPRVITK